MTYFNYIKWKFKSTFNNKSGNQKDNVPPEIVIYIIIGFIAMLLFSFFGYKGAYYPKQTCPSEGTEIYYRDYYLKGIVLDKSAICLKNNLGIIVLDISDSVKKNVKDTVEITLNNNWQCFFNAVTKGDTLIKESGQLNFNIIKNSKIIFYEFDCKPKCFCNDINLKTPHKSKFRL